MKELSFESLEGSLKGKAVSMWSRTGGVFKTLTLVGLFLFIGIKVFPAFTKALDNTAEFAWGITYATFAIACAVATLGFIYFLFTNKTLKMLLMGIWDMIIDNTIGLFIPMNAKALVKARIREKYDEVIKMEKSIDEMAGSEESMKADIEKIDARLHEIENNNRGLASLNQRELERKHLTPDHVVAEIRNNEREKAELIDWKKSITPNYEQLRSLRIGLNQLAIIAKTDAKGYERTANIRIEKYLSMNKAANAVQRFNAIINGQGEKAFMADKSMEYMAEEIAKDTAEIKQVVRRSEDLIRSVNLKDASFDKAAMDYLENYRRKYSDGSQPVQATPVTVIQNNTNTSGGYANLLD